MRTMQYIERTLEEALIKMERSFPVLMVTGPRQSGKSTLLQHILSSRHRHYDYVTLDDPITRARARKDPKLFLADYNVPLIIDEFQYAPELLSYIKIAVDEQRTTCLFAGQTKPQTVYFLTGSQVFQTMNDISESLAGRVGILDLYPLSARELQGQPSHVFWPDVEHWRRRPELFHPSAHNVYERILQGGYPELAGMDGVNRERFFAQYIRTYMERDVRDLANIKNENKFFTFVASLAARTGQEYNPTELARDIEVDRLTIESWTSILKNTYLIYLLAPYYNNNVSRAIKRPKIYFMDTGLACYLTGFHDARSLMLSNYIGAIFETYIVSEIVKSFTNHALDPRLHLYYYRDTLKREIDLLVVRGERMYPVEIKKSSRPTESDAANFALLDKFPFQRQPGVILCQCDRIASLREDLSLVPIEYV